MSITTETSLIQFLTTNKKEKYHDELVAAGINSMQDLCNASFDDLSKFLPKTIARVLKQRATEETRADKRNTDIFPKTACLTDENSFKSFLESIDKLKFHDKLVAADIKTVEDIRNASIDDLSKAVPKSIARILQKKAVEKEAANKEKKDSSSQPAVLNGDNSLKSFLESIDKLKFHDKLVAADIKSVEDVRNASIDDLSKAVPKSIARILQKKVHDFAPVGNSVDKAAHATDSLTFETDEFTAQEIADIRSIWGKLKQSHRSFGKLYYEKLMEMDMDASKLFSGVSIDILARDFDGAIQNFVRSLDNKDAFSSSRDNFIGRLLRYNVSTMTLWLGGDAFVFGACASVPKLEVEHSLDIWARLYYTIIPPFHPQILKAAKYPVAIPKNLQETSSALAHTLASSGHIFYAEFINKFPGFVRQVLSAAQCLKNWTEDEGRWREFKKECEPLLSYEIPAETLLELLVVIIPNAFSKMFGREEPWQHVLCTIAGQAHGLSTMLAELRGRQTEIAHDSWEVIYEMASAQFGDKFYAEFTKDEGIAKIFGRTDLAMQRQRFVHQLNSIFIRIHENPNLSLRPLLLELGARHRVHYLIGLKEMLSVNSAILIVVKDMMGHVHWTIEMQNAWGYALNVVSRFMVVGWTCGVSLIDYEKPIVVQWERNFSADWVSINTTLIGRLRNDSMEAFQSFFHSFASKVAGDGEMGTLDVAANRYMKVVSLIIDEPDISVSRERLGALGARHMKYHGVTLQDMTSASRVWMNVAKDTWGSKFTPDVALEWARLWTMLATCFVPTYVDSMNTENYHMGNTLRGSVGTAKDLSKPYSYRVSLTPKKKAAKSVLSLEKKENILGTAVRLFFDCNPPLDFKAGQYAKIRWTTPDGKNKTRFYSIASAPPLEGPAATLELCIKEVHGGKVSPFVVSEDFVPPDECELMLTAGYFVLPDPLTRVRRLVMSGGIGIVAFMGIIRSAAAMCRAGVLRKKISIIHLHSERTTTFPFKDELLALAKEFDEETLAFTFELILCITRASKDDVENLAKENPCVKFITERPSKEVIANAIDSLSAKAVQDRLGTLDMRKSVAEQVSDDLPHVFVCGPGTFQKAIRGHLLQGCGMPKNHVHQEFFEL